MAALDLEEQEQLSAIKAWWNQWGNLITWAVIAVSVAVIGMQGWNMYSRSQSAKASAVYDALQEAALGGDLKKTREAAGELIEHYGSSQYAALGALLSAKVHVEKGDTKTASAQLEWVKDKAADPVMQDLARLRLAYVMIEEQAFDDAAKLLDGKVDPALAARFMEARGDIHLMRDQRNEARDAYQSALTALDEQIKAGDEVSTLAMRSYRNVVEIKLDAVGGKQ